MCFSELTALEAPAGLRERILADVAAVRPLPPMTTVTAPDVLVRHRAQHSRGRVAGLVAAAAAIAAIGLGAGVAQPWTDDAAPVAEASTTGSKLADAVLAAPDAEEIRDQAYGGSVVLVRSRQLDRAVLVTEGMENAPDGHLFELWFKAGNGALVPAGVMPAGPDNTVVLEGDASDATAVGITVEPDQELDGFPSSPPTVIEFEQA